MYKFCQFSSLKIKFSLSSKFRIMYARKLVSYSNINSGINQFWSKKFSNEASNENK